MPRSPAFRTRLFIALAVALGVATAAMPYWLRQSIVSGRGAASQARLGRAQLAVIAPRFVEQTLVDRLQAAPDVGSAFRDAAPLIAVDGVATNEAGTTLVPRVAVYGVDDRFWRLNGISIDGLADDGLLADRSLADALGVGPGSTVLLTIAHGEDAPRGSVHGRRNDLGRTLRLRLSSTPLDATPPLSPLAATEDVPVAFVPLALLQDEPEWRGRINAILLSTGPGHDRRINTATVEAAIAHHATLADYGLSLRTDPSTRSILVESRTGVLDDDLVDAATRAALDVGGLPTPVMTTLVESMRVGNRSIPYSFVTSIELQAIAPDVHAEELDRPPIVLNEWAAQQLGAAVGDVLSLDFPMRQNSGRLTLESAPFQVAGIIPMTGAALQPALTPAIPGITGRTAMRDWTPRVPFDAGRIRPADADYWTRFATTPKAFVPPQVARALWRTRHGSASAVQIVPADGGTLSDAATALADRLRERVSPSVSAVTVRDLAGDSRTLAEADGRRVGGLTWPIIPFVLACLLTATIRCAVASLTARQAISLAARGSTLGVVASPLLAAVVQHGLHRQYGWHQAAGGGAVPATFAATAATSAVPVLVSLVAGGAAVLLGGWAPPRLSPRITRIASATVVALVAVAVAAMAWTGRSDRAGGDRARRSPFGGYALWIRTTLPLMDDPTAPEGMSALGLSAFQDVRVMPFRVHDGASATLQHPIGPAGLRLAAVSQAFIDEGRFVFTGSLDRSDEERANPWLLLRREQRDRSDPSIEAASPIVPVVATPRALSTLQRRLGDDVSVTVSGRPARLRIVATLAESIFDGALLMAETPFSDWFPDAAGYHWLALEAPRERIAELRTALTATTSRLGGSIIATHEPVNP